MNIVAVIPAHMASIRFPGKILFPLLGLPMIEHVRRRALLSKTISEVIVATCDEQIATVVRKHNGKVIMTAETHGNGTSRVAEAIEKIDCTHVLLLQGDEPLILPRHIDSVTTAIRQDSDKSAWNATGRISNGDELSRNSFVKCSISQSGRIMYCFRQSPATSKLEFQLTYIRKILGIIAYRKEFLLNLVNQDATPIETAEYIEQMRIIESDHYLQSVAVEPSLPSINEPDEVGIVIEQLRQNAEQKSIYSLISSSI